MKIFVSLLILACATSCVAGQKFTVSLSELPQIGDKVPCELSSKQLTLTSSAQLWSFCELTLSGYVFTIAGDHEHRVVYIAVDDSRFRTEEGIGPGSTLQEVRTIVGEDPVMEPGFAYHVDLPSGWKAAFVVGPRMTEGPLQEDAVVKWLFIR